MKKLALFLLAALGPSCGGTSTVLFTGVEVKGPEGFAVYPRKAEDRILAANLDYGIGLRLPYAEDWIFEPSSRKPISGRSSSLKMFVTVQGHLPGRAVEEESYLREEYLKNMKSASERLGVGFDAVEVTKQGAHWVLEYCNEGKLPDGKPFRQTHFWTFRQRNDLAVWEAHVSTVVQDEPQLGETCKRIRQILGNEMKVLPQPE